MSNVLTPGSGIENEEDKLCAYPSCTNSQVVAPSFASQSEIIFFLQIQKEPVSSILLCSMHYKELYKQVKYQSCASCGIKPKKGINLSRHCPNPTIYYNSIFNGDSDHNCAPMIIYAHPVTSSSSPSLRHTSKGIGFVILLQYGRIH